MCIMSREIISMLNSAPKEDIKASATLRIFKNNQKFFSKVLKEVCHATKCRERMLDLGCGFAYLTLLMAKALKFKEAYGVDMDESRLKIANSRIIAIRFDLEHNKFPFPDNYFDLITCFGVLEHLKYYDNTIKEAYRVLKKGGVFLVSVPNLGNWLNRILLLLGYQPRDVEFSNIRAFGLPEIWPLDRRDVWGHIHAPTLKALKDILEYYNFTINHIWGITPSNELKLQLTNLNGGVKTVLLVANSVLSLKPSLSARNFIMSLKV